jgi:hypothetical protein
MRKRRGCAFGECDDPHCYFCVVLPRKFPKVVACPNVLAVEGKRRRCRYVLGHPPPCRPLPGKRGVVDVEAGEESWWT